MKMNECPRYETCSAPVCPLDPDGPMRSHLPGERICIWLNELVKPQGEKRVAAILGDETTQFISQVLPNIAARSGIIRRALEKSPLRGSRLEAQLRLGASRSANKAQLADDFESVPA